MAALIGLCGTSLFAVATSLLHVGPQIQQRLGSSAGPQSTIRDVVMPFNPLPSLRPTLRTRRNPSPAPDAGSMGPQSATPSFLSKPALSTWLNHCLKVLRSALSTWFKRCLEVLSQLGRQLWEKFITSLPYTSSVGATIGVLLLLSPVPLPVPGLSAISDSPLGEACFTALCLLAFGASLWFKRAKADSELRTANTALETVNASLQTVNTALQTEVRRLSVENASRQREIEATRAELDDVKRDFAGQMARVAAEFEVRMAEMNSVLLTYQVNFDRMQNLREGSGSNAGTSNSRQSTAESAEAFVHVGSPGEVTDQQRRGHAAV